MAPEQLTALVGGLVADRREREWVEFKHNKVDCQEVGEYLSALANSAALADEPYGYIVWGVQDGSCQVVGTTFEPHRTKQGNEELEPWLARLLDPQTEVNLLPGTFGPTGPPVVVFRVRAASHAPVAFAGTRYIRVGTSKRKLAAYPDHEKRLWLKVAATPFGEGAARADISGAEALGLIDDGCLHAKLKRSPPDVPAARLDALTQRHVLIARGADRYDVTDAGAVLLARRLADFGPRLGRRAVRIVQYRGRDKTDPVRRYEFDEGYAVGIDRVVEILKAVLPQTERVSLPQLEVITPYPEVAIRELLANALIHQDFGTSGTGPTVELYADRVTFSNPGLPLVDIRRFIDSERSRNVAVARLARAMKLCEESGSGIDRTVAAIEAAHLPPALFDTPNERTRATLYARRPFDAWGREERVLACYQHACLLRERDQEMTNSSLRTRFDLPASRYTAVTRVIQDAIQENLIRELPQLSRSTRDRKYLPFWS